MSKLRDEEIKELASRLRLERELWDNNFYYAELVDYTGHFISQPYLVTEARYKLSRKDDRLNMKLKRGTIYGMD